MDKGNIAITKRKIDEIQKKFNMGELSLNEAIDEIEKCLKSDEFCDDPILNPIVEQMLLALDKLKIEMEKRRRRKRGEENGKGKTGIPG